MVRGVVWDREVHHPGDVLEVTPGEATVLVDIRRQAVRVETDDPVAGMGHRDTVTAPARRGRR